MAGHSDGASPFFMSGKSGIPDIIKLGLLVDLCVRRCVGRSFIPSAVSCRMGMRCLVGQMTNDVSHFCSYDTSSLF